MFEVVNLSSKGVSIEESRRAAKWMARTFEEAPAPPALTIFFGATPYLGNEELHETFWASHLNRVAFSGILLGVKVEGVWRGFRCFFKPGQGRLPYVPDYRLTESQGGNQDWDRFLHLAGDAYMERVKEWARVTGETNRELGFDPSGLFTTSILVVDRDYQRQGIGHALDLETRKAADGRLFVRIHEYILDFYIAQGYRVIASPTYTLLGSQPFKVHFLLFDRDA